MQAAVRDRKAPGRRGGAVDREAIASGPALREMWLTPGEGEDAAAVVGAEVGAGELVRDVERPRRSRRVGSSDGDRDPAQDPDVVNDEHALREVDLEAQRAIEQADASGSDPAEPRVPERGAPDGQPGALHVGDRERLGRSELGPRPTRSSTRGLRGSRGGSGVGPAAPGRRSRGRRAARAGPANRRWRDARLLVAAAPREQCDSAGDRRNWPAQRRRRGRPCGPR